MASVEILAQTYLAADTTSVTFSALDTTVYTYFELLSNCQSALAGSGSPGSNADYLMIRFGEADSIISANQSYSWQGQFAVDGSTGQRATTGVYSSTNSTESSWMNAGVIINQANRGTTNNNCPMNTQFFGVKSGFLSMFQSQSSITQSGSSGANAGNSNFLGQRATGSSAALTDIQLLTYSGSGFEANSSFILTGWKETV